MMTPSKTQAKFTRGEKCIFVHLIITFIILLVMIIIYVIHLGLVKHQGNEIFRITRRSFANDKNSITSGKSISYYFVGAVYLHVTPKKLVCNALLLSRHWSLAPAHCVSIYSEPDMINLMTSWRIKYKFQESEIKETEIKRNIVHSQFSRDDFRNNIGLFEHVRQILSSEYIELKQSLKTNEFLLRLRWNNRNIVNWDNNVVLRDKFLEKNINTISPVSRQKCNEYISPVIKELRNYEFCVFLTSRKEIVIRRNHTPSLNNSNHTDIFPAILGLV
ncbi:uncharacterized protein LOC115452059 isoform X2 [Manduca sexta]|uniref:uncharacterized protein LOC115452059 isoform X2 n=1 Tax=Manduca sexta TaxID=7130 RepID=UPI00188FAFA4|nr:uncharacterized protein LOC115452059 isoform X2 [Manduca sexta]